MQFLYLHLCRFTGGVTEAAARGTSRAERRRRRRWDRRRGRRRRRRRRWERWLQRKGRLWARGPLQPQPGSDGARAAAGPGGAAEAARAPDEGAGKGEEQAAAGGEPGHHARSAHQNVENAAKLNATSSVKASFEMET